MKWNFEIHGEIYHVYVSLCSLFIISYIIYVLFLQVDPNHLKNSHSPILWTSPFFSKNRIKLSDLQRFANLQADLGGSDFSKSDLTGASLEGANLEDVNFENVPRTEKLPEKRCDSPSTNVLIGWKVGGWAEFFSPSIQWVWPCGVFAWWSSQTRNTIRKM